MAVAPETVGACKAISDGRRVKGSPFAANVTIIVCFCLAAIAGVCSVVVIEAGVLTGCCSIE